MSVENLVAAVRCVVVTAGEMREIKMFSEIGFMLNLEQIEDAL